jgi:hypothetical protein
MKRTMKRRELLKAGGAALVASVGFGGVTLSGDKPAEASEPGEAITERFEYKACPCWHKTPPVEGWYLRVFAVPASTRDRYALLGKRACDDRPGISADLCFVGKPCPDILPVSDVAYGFCGPQSTNLPVNAVLCGTHRLSEGITVDSCLLWYGPIDAPSGEVLSDVQAGIDKVRNLV